MRALLFFILVVVVFFLIRFIFKRLEQFRAQPDQLNNSESEPPTEQQMVSCEVCGVHLPEADALGVETNNRNGVNEKKFFCSKDHLQQFVDHHSS